MANPLVPSGTALVEYISRFFTPRLDEPREYTAEKQLHVFGERGSLGECLQIRDDTFSDPCFWALG